MLNAIFDEGTTIDTPFGPKPLFETIGLITQLEAIGCFGTAKLLRDGVRSEHFVASSGNTEEASSLDA